VYPDFLQKHDHFFDRNYTTAFSAGSFSVIDENVLPCSMTRKINHKIWQFFRVQFLQGNSAQVAKTESYPEKQKFDEIWIKKIQKNSFYLTILFSPLVET
jgi:hypothetical protein